MPERNPYQIPKLYESKLNQIAVQLANLQHDEPEFLELLQNWLHHQAEQVANERVQFSYSCLEAILNDLMQAAKERNR